MLYTDYSFALMYTCLVETPIGGKCPRDQSRAVVYGRRKWSAAELPDEVRERLEPVANDACLYLEDFVPAALPSGRYSVLLSFCKTRAVLARVLKQSAL